MTAPFKHALVLEDNDLRGRALVRWLRRDGYTVSVAETAEQAIRILRDVMVYDLVSLDFDLGGGGTGLEVAQCIAALPAVVRPASVRVHSSDDDGAAAMLKVLEAAGVPSTRWALT